jgi:hypothetical protein
LAGLLAQGVAGGFGGWAFYTCAFRAANKPAAE